MESGAGENSHIVWNIIDGDNKELQDMESEGKGSLSMGEKGRLLG